MKRKEAPRARGPAGRGCRFWKTVFELYEGVGMSEEEMELEWNVQNEMKLR